jgi:alkyldihydroxyacetonephosphate synthase
LADARVQAPGALLELPDAVRDELASRLGDGFRADDESRRLFALDGWPLGRVWELRGDVGAFPAAVASPADADQVRAVLRVCARARVPVTPAAGRTGVCGQALPVAGGVVLDLTRLDRVLGLDEESLAVVVEPGILGTALDEHLRASGYTLGHYPQSIAGSSVGGWIACRSAGQYSTRYGKIENMVLGLEAALPREPPHDRIGFRATPASATGPDLLRVFLGSEGTLGVVTQATLRIHPLPPAEQRAAYAFRSFTDGLDALRRVLRRGACPALVRLYDEGESARMFDVDACVLIVLAEGEPPEVAWQAGVVADECTDALDAELVGRWLEHRNDVSALGHAVAAGLVVDTIELSALWRDLPGLYEHVVAAVAAVPCTAAVTAHCSHAYGSGGCLYFTFAGAPDPTDADVYYARVWDAALTAALEAGATLSHHHGIGIVRAAPLTQELTPAGRDLLQAAKDALDPAGVLNPGKLGLADRLAVGTVPWPPR